MTVEKIKALLDACYQAKRARELLPALPKGVTSSYIQYLDAIEQLEREGVRVKVSDISDALHLPRPGVTRTGRGDGGQRVSAKVRLGRGRARDVSHHHRAGEKALADVQRAVFRPARAASRRYFRRGRGVHHPHHSGALRRHGRKEDHPCLLIAAILRRAAF